jgi:hypothetical protein
VALAFQGRHHLDNDRFHGACGENLDLGGPDTARADRKRTDRNTKP